MDEYERGKKAERKVYPFTIDLWVEELERRVSRLEIVLLVSVTFVSLAVSLLSFKLLVK